jgi:PAS domain-containing protein
MDITEHKLAEGALRARELNLRLLLDSIPTPAALMTSSGEVETVNKPSLEYFGRR